MNDIFGKYYFIRHKYDTLPAPHIDMSQLEFVSVLGNGQFADVHLCRLNKIAEPTMVAVKRMHADSAHDLLSEAHTMAKLRHRNIVRVLGVCAKTAPYAIITEYMCNGDVNQYLLANSMTIRYFVTFNTV
jgi:serine/threonine protein kinase